MLQFSATEKKKKSRKEEKTWSREASALVFSSDLEELKTVMIPETPSNKCAKLRPLIYAG